MSLRWRGWNNKQHRLQQSLNFKFFLQTKTFERCYNHNTILQKATQNIKTLIFLRMSNLWHLSLFSFQVFVINTWLFLLTGGRGRVVEARWRQWRWLTTVQVKHYTFSYCLVSVLLLHHWRAVTHYVNWQQILPQYRCCIYVWHLSNQIIQKTCSQNIVLLLCASLILISNQRLLNKNRQLPKHSASSTLYSLLRLWSILVFTAM